MTQIYETQNKIRKVSTKSQALILPIPATIRDIMNFRHGTPVKWEIHAEDDRKIIKIYENMD